jgi:hypothetical protein
MGGRSMPSRRKRAIHGAEANNLATDDGNYFPPVASGRAGRQVPASLPAGRTGMTIMIGMRTGFSIGPSRGRRVGRWLATSESWNGDRRLLVRGHQSDSPKFAVRSTTVCVRCLPETETARIALD